MLEVGEKLKLSASQRRTLRPPHQEIHTILTTPQTTIGDRTKLKQ